MELSTYLAQEEKSVSETLELNKELYKSYLYIF